MLKFMVLLVLGITVFASRKKIKKKFLDKFGVSIKLICYYGGVGIYYESDSPSEYVCGNKFWVSKRSKRFQYQNGLKSMNSPRQAFQTIYYFENLFKVKRNGARIVSETQMPPDKEGEVGWIWMFDKSPYQYGIRPSDRKHITKLLWSSFKYYMVDKWPANLSGIEVRVNNQKLLDLYERYLLAETALEKSRVKDAIDAVRRRFDVQEMQELDDLIKHVDLIRAVNADIASKGWIDDKGKKRYDNPKLDKEPPLPSKRKRKRY